MTTERKLLYVFGAVIIAAMIAIASFSLGIYIGEQGWTLRAPSMAGPAAPQPRGQGQPQQPKSPDGPAQPAPGGNPPRPDLIGLARRVTGDSLELETQQGLRSVLMDNKTRLVRLVDGKEKPAQQSDLRQGVRVAIFGEFGGDGRTLTARLVVILPPPK